MKQKRRIKTRNTWTIHPATKIKCNTNKKNRQQLKKELEEECE